MSHMTICNQVSHGQCQVLAHVIGHMSVTATSLQCLLSLVQLPIRATEMGSLEANSDYLDLESGHTTQIRWTGKPIERHRRCDTSARNRSSRSSRQQPGVLDSFRSCGKTLSGITSHIGRLLIRLYVTRPWLSDNCPIRLRLFFLDIRWSSRVFVVVEGWSQTLGIAHHCGVRTQGSHCLGTQVCTSIVRSHRPEPAKSA